MRTGKRVGINLSSSINPESNYSLGMFAHCCVAPAKSRCHHDCSRIKLVTLVMTASFRCTNGSKNEGTTRPSHCWLRCCAGLSTTTHHVRGWVPAESTGFVAKSITRGARWCIIGNQIFFSRINLSNPEWDLDSFDVHVNINRYGIPWLPATWSTLYSNDLVNHF